MVSIHYKPPMAEAPGADPIIRIEALDKWFGDFQVLRGIDLSVGSGEKVVICGPSGSGKSTLIRCVCRLERHQRGRIVVDGYELNDETRSLAVVRSEVGMVFQSFNLFPHLSVLENLTLAPMRVRKLAPKEAQDLAMELLVRVRIPEQAHKYPAQLSGGQQQRVAIARALVQDPDLILADEPIASLDPHNTKIVMDALRRINRDFGITVICNLHSLELARSYCGRLIGMAAGRVVFDGTPEQLTELEAQRLYGLDRDARHGAAAGAADSAAEESVLGVPALA